ncbi:L,D-transpeptidase-like protein [Krasilnikovia cinnamomea]|uniref:L,D-transpeptidase-like protein n=2 Tax=Krasilnikovia cinnamomea TaxID=349313 RepID=A0A4Q7ZPH4_9ACTN|nr:L,D-transpeptidase-like protein [Krasilnikovia cinnamomea]
MDQAGCPRKVENGDDMVGRQRSLVAVGVVAVFALTACTGGADASPDPQTSSAPPTAAPQPVAATVPLALAITPATGKKDLPVSTEIGLKLAGGTVKTVTLRDAKGGTVAGTLRPDGSAWVPAKPLKHKQRYAATVTAADPGGATTTATTTFTTMPEPARRTGTGLYLFDDHTYGVAMPVVAEFNPGIKKKDRAAVQKRMFVQTDPPQPGAWSWTSSGTQAYYRAPKFWQPGTQLKVRLAVGGLPTGGGRYGTKDRAATAKIGRSFEMKVENKTKKMTVLREGKVVRTIPVSLGKPSTPSSSGTMVVMDKHTSTVFDTTDTDGANGYRMNIDYAQRLTWSGQYVHSASWSVGAQGHRNVSHGCVNVSPSNARWLFDHTLIGDPITVRGTGDKLVQGNGWTAWDLSWENFIKGSALPVPADLK